MIATSTLMPTVCGNPMGPIVTFGASRLAPPIRQVLSAGVGHEDFRTQVEIAGKAGASGYLAGRSIWRDAVSYHVPAERAAAIELAGGRLDELNKVTRAYGRPIHPAASLPEAIEAMPDGWFSSWHPAT
ncbi:hypothetical protein AB0P37_32795 [Streptomyces antimycoticus]|uniref:hypothetical protein n=1 Tax=Streptomyces antimycoticus TaxID=68175 RepID=UPI0034356A01